MQFGIHLVREGIISAKSFVKAVELQLRDRPQIGTLALESHKLTVGQVLGILSAQVDSNLPFGQQAVALGYLRNRELVELLGLQCALTRPLHEYVVRLGLASQNVIDEELANYRSNLTTLASLEALPGDIEPTFEVDAVHAADLVAAISAT